MVRALELAPQIDTLWAQFADLIRFFNFRHPLDPRLHAVLARALEHPAVDPGELVRPISSTALSRGAEQVFNDPLLLRLLEETVIRDPQLEHLLVLERRKALREGSVPVDTLVAIAHQCFNTEYVFAESEDERAELAKLARSAHLRDLAVYAAYRPLNSLPEANDVAKRLESTPLASLARRQIVEPADEQALRAGLASFGGPASAVSAAVRAQYEENPYPRWRRVPLITPEERTPSRVLIAGCGTGQHAISTALRMPQAKLLAIDLSVASLAYAKRKTTELGVANIEYRQADLLSLRPEGGRFDHVEASGVLHHLEDPLAGWRVLTDLVEPGGSMRIGLYSERGRRAIVRARELIAEQGFPPTPEGIRRCRAAILARAQDDLFARLVRNEDFYSMSGCRDLLFHVQEHRLDLPRVKQMIGELGLVFAGFEFADSGMSVTRYAARYPHDAAMTDLDNWDRLEGEYPDTFSRMYQFRVLKPR
ncbi:MAG TPA: methyltransferase domain-containing protein [Burkholderiales bacterium]|nr:methyltransferase domain-containing protein [Burkholderiales bacterium]